MLDDGATDVLATDEPTVSDPAPCSTPPREEEPLEECSSEPSAKRQRSNSLAEECSDDSISPVFSMDRVVPIPAGRVALNAYCREKAVQHPEDEAFYVMDLGAVERQLADWLRLLPRVEPFYAVKCMTDTGLMATLANAGCGFDCASPAEIAAAEALGADAARIIYANPAKPVRHIQRARACGVYTTTFDSEYELRKLAEHMPEARCVLRIKADDPTARCPLGTKYGALPGEVEPLLRAAKSLGLVVEGISFHVGSGAQDPAAFARAIVAARAAFDLAVKLGHPPLRLLDLGGGFSGVGAADGGVALETVAVGINAALQEHFPESEGVRIIAEPGRYFAQPMGTLCTQVFSKRVREIPVAAPEKPTEGWGADALGSADGTPAYLTKPDSHEYWLMDGLYGSFNCILYDHATVAARMLFDREGAKTHRSTLYGPTCDGLDTIARGVELPELSLGEWLVFDNMGAYTRAAGSAFNGYDTAHIRTYYVRSA